MKLSIVIVSWNVKEDLEQCLRSVEADRPQGQSEVMVVDNASNDDTVETLRLHFPAVQVIANKENLGFAGANNQAMRRACGQYILLLNPDTLMHMGGLGRLIHFMDSNPDVGACAPRLLNADGTIQRSVRRFPTFGSLLHQYTIFRPLGVFRLSYNRWRMKGFAYNSQADVDQPMGAALMVRRSVIDQVGPLDERFVMYYEEVDWCARIKEHGWRIVYVPSAEVTHLDGRSSGQILGSDRSMMLLRSALTFFRKHRGQALTMAFSVLFKPAVLLGSLYSMLAAGMTYMVAGLRDDRRRLSLAALRARESARMLTRNFWTILFRL